MPQDMMDACVKSGVFEGTVNWQQPDGGPVRGKRCDNSITRAALGGWKPKYESFESFMMQNKGKDFYNTSGLF